MTYLSKTMILVAGLALAACTNPDRFANQNNVDLNGSGLSGAASDPTSPAYFQQAVGDRVLFAVDQSTLSREAQATLDGQAEWLMTNRDFTPRSRAMPTSRAPANTTSPSARGAPTRCRNTSSAAAWPRTACAR